FQTQPFRCLKMPFTRGVVRAWAGTVTSWLTTVTSLTSLYTNLTSSCQKVIRHLYGKVTSVLLDWMTFLPNWKRKTIKYKTGLCFRVTVVKPSVRHVRGNALNRKLIT